MYSQHGASSSFGDGYSYPHQQFQSQPHDYWHSGSAVEEHRNIWEPTPATPEHIYDNILYPADTTELRSATHDAQSVPRNVQSPQLHRSAEATTEGFLIVDGGKQIRFPSTFVYDPDPDMIRRVKNWQRSYYSHHPRGNRDSGVLETKPPQHLQADFNEVAGNIWSQGRLFLKEQEEGVTYLVTHHSGGVKSLLPEPAVGVWEVVERPQGSWLAFKGGYTMTKKRFKALSEMRGLFESYSKGRTYPEPGATSHY